MNIEELRRDWETLKGNKKALEPPIFCCSRCHKGIRDPKLFLNGKAIHTICLPYKYTRGE